MSINKIEVPGKGTYQTVNQQQNPVSINSYRSSLNQPPVINSDKGSMEQPAPKALKSQSPQSHIPQKIMNSTLPIPPKLSMDDAPINPALPDESIDQEKPVNAPRSSSITVGENMLRGLKQSTAEKP